MLKKKRLTIFDTRHFPIRPQVGVGILLVRNQKLLLVKRKYNPDAGYWSIPGGHIELGERVEDAAEREGLEETGIKVKVINLAGIINKITHEKNGKIEYHYVLINYFVEQVEGNMDQVPKPDSDALDARFVKFSELKNYKLAASLVELLKILGIGY